MRAPQLGSESLDGSKLQLPDGVWSELHQRPYFSRTFLLLEAKPENLVIAIRQGV